MEDFKVEGDQRGRRQEHNRICENMAFLCVLSCEFEFSPLPLVLSNQQVLCVFLCKTIVICLWKSYLYLQEEHPNREGTIVELKDEIMGKLVAWSSLGKASSENSSSLLSISISISRRYFHITCDIFFLQKHPRDVGTNQMKKTL